MNHIDTGRAQPRGRTTSSSSWETATSMEMAMESMEMASRAIPCPGRVPEQRLLSPEIGLQWRSCCRTFLGEMPIDLGFLHQKDYIGGRAMSGGGPGGHTTWWLSQRRARHPMVCLPPGPLPSPLWTPSHAGENTTFGLCFVQFREYFMCNYSETQKQQKTAN
jgi:hypothetical protein